ncbi:DUF1613-domain-containing protein [Lojkania enalia]|uniref:tRNA (uracil-O(2)-)-methyltransferase n=1 Tax=Lojkania enalia TaxID=147567 RepID=A0A9P4K6E7_9PLEO|nr:DUF1613-domain-containing protein [Didymosphaeria enalia]
MAESGDIFQPTSPEDSRPFDSGLPSELWILVLSSPARFPPQFFLDVSRNLLENPNLTASHLSRAELSYSSFADATFNPSAQHPHELARIIKHLKPDHQPLLIPGGFPGYALEWTVVRKLIPRNPKLDKPLLQTCHLFTSTKDIPFTDSQGNTREVQAERYLIIYLPHVSSPEEVPFYHPKVQALAILYTYIPTGTNSSAPGTLFLYYKLFSDVPLDNRLNRTALCMLEITHKHSRGRQAGYVKRVHHDVVIPQKAFQNTYAYLKGKYAQGLIEGWVEQTPPEKHVFEDLGIAAFCMELWKEMYSDKRDKNFPGFVDIGCGNGLLVWILNQEGWRGWGFDARRRKTWDAFGEAYNEKLKAMLLVPEILTTSSPSVHNDTATPIHNGIFPERTFLIANHADELTIWTPLFAHLSSSPFIAIPCCSHNFNGARFRAPSKTPPKENKGAKSGKQPSAYASFCSYVGSLTSTMRYVEEKEYLRIPSTRNVAIIGRNRVVDEEEMPLEGKLEFVRRVVEKEMGDVSIEGVGREWVDRGAGLVKGKGCGH